MQLFPVASQMSDTAASSSSSSGSFAAFDGILASYIEANRYEYAGRPNGFATQGPESGTIDYDTGSRFSEELRRRNVNEENIERVESLLASESPATIGTIFGTLSGQGRYSEELDEQEAIDFKAALAKLGFNKEEQDELMALSDAGDSAALFERISAKLAALEGSIELSKGEWKSLLRGLDASNNALTGLMAFFADADQLSLSAADLKLMLAGYQSELAERKLATAHATEAMREAMAQALAASKANERSEAVNDIRGNRLTEHSESLMLNSVRKNTGSDDLKRDGQFDADEEGFENRKDGKSRSERILATADDLENGLTRKPTASSNSNGATQALLTNLTAAPDVQAVPQGMQTSNTAFLAQNKRQEIFAQVEQGLLQSAMNGGQRLTLQLNPGELGQITVMLSVHQGEIRATIRAENHDSADVLRSQLAELRSSLEAEGLKVKELDVQTGQSDQSLAERWASQQEHNQMRDASERDRMMRLSRIRRDAAGQSTIGGQLEHTPTGTGTSGIHVVA